MTKTFAVYVGDQTFRVQGYSMVCGEGHIKVFGKQPPDNEGGYPVMPPTVAEFFNITGWQEVEQ